MTQGEGAPLPGAGNCGLLLFMLSSRYKAGYVIPGTRCDDCTRTWVITIEQLEKGTWQLVPGIDYYSTRCLRINTYMLRIQYAMDIYIDIRTTTRAQLVQNEHRCNKQQKTPC